MLINNEAWLCNVRNVVHSVLWLTMWHRLTLVQELTSCTYSTCYDEHLSASSLLHRVMQHKIVFAVAIVVVLVIIALLIFGIVKIKQAADSKKSSWPNHFLYVNLLFEYGVFLNTHFSKVRMYACEWACMYVCTCTHFLFTAGIPVYSYTLHSLTHSMLQV